MNVKTMNAHHPICKKKKIQLCSFNIEREILTVRELLGTNYFIRRELNILRGNQVFYLGDPSAYIVMVDNIFKFNF